MEELIGPILAFGVPLMLLALGFFSGRHVERKHLRQLDQREARVRHLIVTNTKFIPPELGYRRAEILLGEAVIGSDYFKNFLAGLRSFFGGELKSLETLMDRARREATLRVLEVAAAQGASAVFNIRLETSNIGAMQGKKQAPMAEVLVYGTACYRE